MSKVILYIAISEDGYIADTNGGVDWLPKPDDLAFADPEDELGYNRLLNRISTIVMGSKSYEQILTFGYWAWKHKQTYVFTKRETKSNLPYIHFTHDTPEAFVKKFKEENRAGDIWLLGGAELAKSFDEANLIDEYVITVIKKKLGDGIKLNVNYRKYPITHIKPFNKEIFQITNR